MSEIRTSLFMICICLVSGCAAFHNDQRTTTPAVLQGSNQEIRERLLKEIPTGTSQQEAERIVRSLGLELQPNLDPNSDEPLILCNFTGKQGRRGEVTWLVQIDCPDGKVTDIICEQIGVEY